MHCIGTTTPVGIRCGQLRCPQPLYVLCLNRWYADEMYHAMVVRPTLGLARWLMQVVEIRGIDRAVHGIAHMVTNDAQRMWQIIEIRGIDRLVNGMGSFAISLARWLWAVVEIRGIDRVVDDVGHHADNTGHVLQKMDRPLIRQQMLVMIFWLAAAIGLFYWFEL